MKPQLSTRLLHPSNLSISWVRLKTVWSLSGAKSQGPSSGKHSPQRHHCIFPNCQAIASFVAIWSAILKTVDWHLTAAMETKGIVDGIPGHPVDPTVKACSVMSTARIKMLIEDMQLKWQWLQDPSLYWRYLYTHCHKQCIESQDIFLVYWGFMCPIRNS